MRQGKIYRAEKVEQALTTFFREGNLSTLRERALHAVADEVSEKAARYRKREGLEPAVIPETGAPVVRVKADKPADGLIAFAQREGITHVIFGQSARSRWEIVMRDRR